jgi:hypothetical protein
MLDSYTACLRCFFYSPYMSHVEVPLQAVDSNDNVCLQPFREVANLYHSVHDVHEPKFKDPKNDVLKFDHKSYQGVSLISEQPFLLKKQFDQYIIISQSNARSEITPISRQFRAVY